MLRLTKFFTSAYPLLQGLRDQARDNIVAQLTQHVDPSNILVVHQPHSPPMTDSQPPRPPAWRIWFDHHMPAEFNLTPAENRYSYGEPQQLPDQTNYLMQWSYWGFLAQCRQLLDEEIGRLIDMLFVFNEAESARAFFQLLDLAEVFNLPLSLVINYETRQITINENEPLSCNIAADVEVLTDQLLVVFEDIYSHDLSLFNREANKKISLTDLFCQLSVPGLAQLFFSSPTVWNQITYPHLPKDWQVIFIHPGALFLLNLMCCQNETATQIILPDHRALDRIPLSVRGLLFTPITDEIQPWQAFIESRKKALSLQSTPIETVNKEATLSSLVTHINGSAERETRDSLLQLLTDVLSFFQYNAQHHLVECASNPPRSEGIAQKIMRSADTIDLNTIDFQALDKLTLDSTHWLIVNHYSALDTRHAAFLVGHILLLIFLSVPGHPPHYSSSEAHLNKARFEIIGIYAQPLIQALLTHDVGLDTTNHYSFEYWLYLFGKRIVPNNEDNHSFFEEAFTYTLQAYLFNAPEFDTDPAHWQRFIKLIQADGISHRFLDSFFHCSALANPNKLNRLIRLLTDPQIIPLLMEYEEDSEGKLADLLSPFEEQIWPLLLSNEEFRTWWGEKQSASSDLENETEDESSAPIPPPQPIVAASTYSSVLSEPREDQGAESKGTDETDSADESDDDEDAPPRKRPRKQ